MTTENVVTFRSVRQNLVTCYPSAVGSAAVVAVGLTLLLEPGASPESKLASSTLIVASIGAFVTCAFVCARYLRMQIRFDWDDGSLTYVNPWRTGSLRMQNIVVASYDNHGTASTVLIRTSDGKKVKLIGMPWAAWERVSAPLGLVRQERPRRSR